MNLKGVNSFLSNFTRRGIQTTGNSIQGIFNGESLNSFAQGLGSTLNNLSGVTETNAFNAQEAQKQRDWEERMSNTQYQRTVSDMQAAGINPTALFGGAGLTTLGSSQAATSSGNSAAAFGSVLNAITGLVRAVKGGSKISNTKNFYYQKK